MSAGAHVPVGTTQMTRPAVVVVAAAVVEQDGRFLLTRRLEGTHLAGRWEFPGGKCERGETHHDALARELDEELAVRIAVGSPILSTTYAYEERTVELHFYETRLLGMPVPQLGQEMRWASREELGTLDLPEADAVLIRLLANARPG
jgi:8-oxo-dGTP diphosphatase